jgi:hypothetical protein
VYRCPNHNDKSKGDRGTWYVAKWAPIYLKDALERLKGNMKGFDLVVEDVYAMQQLCAYEVHYPVDSVDLAFANSSVYRLWRWDTPSSVSYSPKRNGMDLTMREQTLLSNLVLHVLSRMPPFSLDLQFW